LGLAGIGAVVGAIVLFSPKSNQTAGAGQKAAIKTSASAAKAAESPPVPPANDPAPKAGPPSEDLAKLKEYFDSKKYSETVKLAQDILAKFPADPAAQDYLKKARSGLVYGQVAPFLQSGISSYNQGNYAQCVLDMEKVLNLDKDNAEAQRYLFQADTALSKKDILALIERHRAAEESKDLLTVLSDVSSPALSGQWQGEYKMLFNGYDGITSSVSGISVTFSGRTEATASFSHLLTAVYKKDGKKKIVFEGNKSWRLRRQGKAWTLTGTG